MQSMLGFLRSGVVGGLLCTCLFIALHQEANSLQRHFLVTLARFILLIENNGLPIDVISPNSSNVWTWPLWKQLSAKYCTQVVDLCSGGSESRGSCRALFITCSIDHVEMLLCVNPHGRCWFSGEKHILHNLNVGSLLCKTMGRINDSSYTFARVLMNASERGAVAVWTASLRACAPRKTYFTYLLHLLRACAPKHLWMQKGELNTKYLMTRANS